MKLLRRLHLSDESWTHASLLLGATFQIDKLICLLQKAKVAARFEAAEYMKVAPKRVQRRVEIGRVITFQLEQELRVHACEGFRHSFIHPFI